VITGLGWAGSRHCCCGSYSISGLLWRGWLANSGEHAAPGPGLSWVVTGGLRAANSGERTAGCCPVAGRERLESLRGMT
jgi:hypothetical protein